MNCSERIAELRAAAAARGLRLPSGGGRRPVGLGAEPRINETASRREYVEGVPGPVERAAGRPLPSVNTGRNERHGERLTATRLRLAAWLVARTLGPDWYLQDADKNTVRNDGYCGTQRRYIVHRPTGSRLRFGINWRDNSRLTIAACDGLREDCREITANIGRSPRSIAGDVERKILSRNVLQYKVEVEERAKLTRRSNVKQRLAILRLCRAIGLKDTDKYRYRHDREEGGYVEIGDSRIECRTYHGEFSVTVTGPAFVAERVAEAALEIVNKFKDS